MRSRVMVALSAAAFALCGLVPPVAHVAVAKSDAALAGSTTSGWKLQWADEFRGSRLSSNWAHRPAPSPSRLCSREVSRLARVSGGTLRLSVREDDNPPAVPDGACEYGQFVTASIGTAAAKRFKYGLFEARIRFDGAHGGHGAFWMQPARPPSKRTGDARKDGAEIDVAEYFGDGFSGGGLRNSVHYYKKQDGRLTAYRVDTVGEKTPKKFRARNISSSYHVFSVEWTPKEYIFRMDGTETFRTKRGVSQIPQYLILSQVSSDWEQRRIDDGPDDMDTYVDWVRVYQR